MPTEQESIQGQEHVVSGQVSPQSQEKKGKDEIHEMTTLHERTIAMLSYAGPLAIVPFYLKKESKFCRFHGKQGMVLAIIFFISKLLSVLDVVMDLMLILQVGIFFFMGFKAISGKWHKLPWVYNWADKLEKSLTLKTLEEELEEVRLAPGEVTEDPAKTEVNPSSAAQESI